MNDIHLYSGFVKINPDEPFKFEVEEIEIERVHEDGVIKTKHSYFTSSINSTDYFGGSWNNLDKVYEINDYMLVIYSTEKQKCMDFLVGKRKEISGIADNLLKRLNQSKIEDLVNVMVKK